MIGTILGLLLGIFSLNFGAHFFDIDTVLWIKTFPLWILSLFPFSLIIFYFFALLSLLKPLQKAELAVCPRLINLFRKDSLLGFIHLGLFTFSSMALMLGLTVEVLPFPFEYTIATWFLFVGISLDLLIALLRRSLAYLNPFAAIKFLRKAAIQSIQNKNESELCEWVDVLAEVGSRSIALRGCSLCNEVLEELHIITQKFLVIAKGMTFDSEKNDLERRKDNITFILFYIFQRMEMIFNQALLASLEPICSKVLSVFGKIAIDATHYDISLTSFPLQSIGKLSLAAHQEKLQDIGVKAVCLYLEVARALLKDIDVTYLELKEPFFTMIHYMDEHAKEAFKQNKELPIKILVQPFHDLKTFFTHEKMIAHQDTVAILSDIDRVLAEFSALEMVLKTIPPIPSFGEEKNNSEK